MKSVRELSYVVAGAKDLDAWERFATAGLGLEVYARDANRLYLRNGVNAYRLCMEKSDKEDLIALGWDVQTEAELDAFAKHLESLGIRVQHGTKDDTAKRRVVKLIRFLDPNGFVNEIVWGLEIKEQRPFRSPIFVDGFKTDEGMGFGHVVLSVDNLERSLAFYQKGLGHQISNIARIGDHLEAYFLRCNARHHSMAIAESGRATKLQHVQFEYKTFDDVGRAMDRAEDLGIPIVAGLGRHIGDWVMSFYVRSPSGLVIEIGYGSRIMPDYHATELEVFSGSLWGHRKGMENC